MEVLLGDIAVAQKEGVPSYDCVSERKCLLIPVLLCVLADNPRASELSASNNCTALAPCRFCIISKNELRNGIHDARPKSTQECMTVRAISQSMSNERKQALLRKYGIKEHCSAFERVPLLGFDVYKDFPVEILHTVLLGPIKYCVNLAKKKLNAISNEEIMHRLSGINWDGMKSSIPSASYKYVGSWVGRDFKVR